MPFTANRELPESVRSVLPEAAQSIFREAFNSALYDDGSDSIREGVTEEDAMRAAWGAVENAGYKKGADGKYHKDETMANLSFSDIRVIGDKGEASASVLFDTGATISFIARDLALQIATIVKMAEPINIVLGDGRSVTVSEQALISVPLGARMIADNFAIMPGLVREIIIGLSTLRKFQIKIDLGRDAIMAQLKTAPRKESFMKEFLTKLFAALGISASEELTEEKAIELIKEKAVQAKNKDAPKIVAAPAVLTLLELKENATEAEVKGKIMALQRPGDKVDAAEHEKLKGRLFEMEVKEVVETAIGTDGKLYAHERDWAVEQAKKDIDGFKAFLANRGKVTPINLKLADKKEDKTLGAIDDTQAAINRQLGVSVETFKKYNASAN